MEKKYFWRTKTFFILVMVIAGVILVVAPNDRKQAKAEQGSNFKLDPVVAADPEFQKFCQQLDQLNPGDLLRLEFTNSANSKVSSQIFAVAGKEDGAILVYSNPRLAAAGKAGQLFVSSPKNQEVLYQQLQILPKDTEEYQFAKIIFDGQR